MGTNIRYADPSGDSGGHGKRRPQRSLGRGFLRLMIIVIILLGSVIASGCLGGDACVAYDYLRSIAIAQDIVLGADEADLAGAVVTLAVALGAAVVLVAMLVWVALGFGTGRHD